MGVRQGNRILHPCPPDVGLSGDDGCSVLATHVGLSETWGTLFWGPYNKDPTFKGTILGSPIFGNPHVLKGGEGGSPRPPNPPFDNGAHQRNQKEAGCSKTSTYFKHRHCHCHSSHCNTTVMVRTSATKADPSSPHVVHDIVASEETDSSEQLRSRLSFS